MEHITEFANLKVGYIYFIQDTDNEDYIVIKNLDGAINAESIVVEYGYNMGPGIISKVGTSDTNFKDSKYAFYEIGLLEEHPEYLL